MQNLIYDEAPYDILYYDANLDVYRTDRFAGWQNMPANGTPLFTYGILNYTLLTDATAAPSPGAVRGGASPAASGDASSAAPATPATPAPSPATGSTSDGGSSTLLIGGLVGLVVVVIVGGLIVSRRRKSAPVDDE